MEWKSDEAQSFMESRMEVEEELTNSFMNGSGDTHTQAMQHCPPLHPSQRIVRSAGDSYLPAGQG